MTIRYFLALVFLLAGFNSAPAATPELRDLPWPVELNRWPHQFGPNFGQFQDLGSRYFHAGQDIVSHTGAPVSTPVSGVLGGGFYTYKDFPNGHSEKILVTLRQHLENPSPEKFDRRFFEVSVTTDSGYRFEFHHVDPDNLDESIKQKILEGGRVSAGEIIGYVVDFELHEFGVKYDHIHYNVYDPDNKPMNPMVVSKALKDTVPPEINMMAYGKGSRCKSQPGQFFQLYNPSTRFIPKGGQYLIFQARDHLSGNSIAQAPTKVEVEFFGHSTIVYDFSKDLFDPQGVPLDIRSIYQEEFCTGVPDFALPVRGSTYSDFFIKVQIPADFEGRAEIRVLDFVGNRATRTVFVGQE